MTVAGGPSVVALGGGHGLASTLRAVRHYAGRITAVVSVADDGGSSGRLRRAFGIPAPGDLRRCLVALGNDDALWCQVFEHRFHAGELEGHAVGNIVIAGLAGATGDFGVALDEAARLVEADGRVLPATSVPVVLKAEAESGPVEGQVNVSSAGRISHIWLVPPDPPTPDEAVAAIAAADQVVIGPGSLFSSVLAATVVPALRTALRTTSAQRVYVCNLREQPPETAGFDVAAHVDSLVAHGVEADVVLSDPGALPLGRPPWPVVRLPVARPDGLAHDPAALGSALRDLLG